MSNLDERPQESLCTNDTPDGPVLELLTGREVVIGTRDGTVVTRTLPNKNIRMVGAWCFADHYGPSAGSMRVAPHPHTGIQTVSWLVEGEVLHRDTLGNEQLVRPGQLNIMTAGRAIAHSEESPVIEQSLHGVQLWVALPAAARDMAGQFEHHATLPGVDGVTVIVGELDGVVSPATVHTPLVAAEITLSSKTSITLKPTFEYAVLALTGSVSVEGVSVGVGPLLYLGCGRSEVSVEGTGKVLLLGGEPFDEELVMWWNFVGRSHDEIVRMREEWLAGEVFGEVNGYPYGDRLPAPPLPTLTLKPRGRRMSS